MKGIGDSLILLATSKYEIISKYMSLNCIDMERLKYHIVTSNSS